MQLVKEKITFIRGDDDGFTLALKTGAFEEGDKVFFSLKADATKLVDIFQIESTEFVPYIRDGVEVPNAAVKIAIPHALTIGLELQTYYYDILIRWANGTNVTVVPPADFKVVAGGSHAS